MFDREQNAPSFWQAVVSTMLGERTKKRDRLLSLCGILVFLLTLCLVFWLDIFGNYILHSLTLSEQSD